MIEVNNVNVEWEEGLTIEILLNNLKNNSSIVPILGYHTIVIINGDVIRAKQYPTTLIQDRDDVKVIPLVGGG